MPDLAEAKKLLTQAVDDCTTAREKADKHGRYTALLASTEQLVTFLNDHAQKDTISKEREDIQKKIDKAKVDVATDQPKALELLETAAKDCAAARTKADIQANLKSDTVDRDFLKMLVKEPGGKEALDKLMENLPEDTSNDVVMAALEARFNLTMKEYLTEDVKHARTNMMESDRTASGKTTKQIYKVLKMVPESHVGDNDKVKEIKRFTQETGGAAYGGGKVYLNCGREGPQGSSNQAAELSSPGYFPDGVDPDCEPANDDPVTYFDWATLHEVGHAVDDKKGFMKKNGKASDYGGWKEYGSDVTEVVKAAETRFKCDKDYMKQKLEGGTPDANDSAFTHEEAGDVAKFDEWHKLVSAQKLWWDGSGSKSVAIGGRVYQMAYDDDWVSYDLAARMKGIHGYQFRAPAEWFAELYAAFFSGKLKESHPSASWLKSL